MAVTASRKRSSPRASRFKAPSTQPSTVSTRLAAPSPPPPSLQADINRALAPFSSPASIWVSLGYLGLSLLYCAATGLVFAWLRPLLPTAVWIPLYSAVQGTCAVGLWVLGHECGHGAFAKQRAVNDAIGFVLHSALLVPYFSWRHTHALHHRYTNHMTRGETHVPPISPSAPRSRLPGRLGSWGAIVVICFVGWPMYLCGLGSERHRKGSHFRVGDAATAADADAPRPGQRGKFRPALRWRVHVSGLGCAVTAACLVAARQRLGWDVLAWCAGPYVVVNGWLVLITLLHHTHPAVPHFGADEFSWLRGALATVDRPYPWPIDHLHHHIGSTHVLHHLNPRIPHYRAQAATAALVPVLGPHYRHDTRPIARAAAQTVAACLFVRGERGVQLYQPGAFSVG